jgi:hypothetical protein
MSTGIKYNLSRIGTVTGVVMVCAGIYNMMAAQNSAGMKGVGLLVAGLFIGIPSCLAYYYLKNKPDDSLDQQKIAVETLAKLSESNQNKHE